MMEHFINGMALKKYRKDNNVTLRKMAEYAGITLNAYRRIEIGQSIPKGSTILHLCNNTNLDPVDFFDIRLIPDEKRQRSV